MRSALFSGVLVATGIGCGGISQGIGEESGVDVGGRGGSISVTGGSGNLGGSGNQGPGGQGGTGQGGTGQGGQGGTVIIDVGGQGGAGGSVIGVGATGAVGAAGPVEPPPEPPGPSLCGGAECVAPSACCQTTARCFDPVSEPELCLRPEPDPDDSRTPCASSAHCGGDEYCAIDMGTHCQGQGFCQSRVNCGASSFPVCACDGNSYGDIGAACRAGASVGVFWGGFCGDSIDANDPFDDATGVPPRWVTLCGSDAHCAADERCCSITSICYPVSDPGRCQLPPEGTLYPCTADDQCYSGYEYCAGDGCEGPGGCSRFDPEEQCGIRFEPVCGCDGVTYTSAPCASAAGVRVASEGECNASE